MASTNANSPVFRPCPLCGQAETDSFLRKAELHLVRCRGCDMVYANPVATDLASGEFYDRAEAPYYLSPDKLEGDYAPVRFERELRIFRAYCEGGAVLDVGCSTGAFLFQLQTRYPGAYTVAGTDVAGAALDYAASRGITVIRQSFVESDLGDARYDAVTFWAVLEHVIHPRRFLGQAARILKPGGYCFMLVPNLGSLAARLLGSKYRYIMPDHVNYFTALTLKRLAQGGGIFEPVALHSTHFNPIVLWQDWRRGGPGRVADEERARLLQRTTAYKQNPLLQPVKAVYSGLERVLGWMRLADNLVVVARKIGAGARVIRPARSCE